MPIGPEDLAKLVPKETIHEFYKDALSYPAKELGKLGTDVVKTSRLILFPLQIMATLQDRLENTLRRVAARVPEDRRIEAPAEVVGPCIEHMRYLAEESDLWHMYEEIITKAVDREAASKIHPSFPRIVSQLSRDEAWILYRLRDNDFKVVDTLELDRASNLFSNRKIEISDLPVDELYLPDQLDLFYSHLESLNLVTWPVVKQTPIVDGKNQTGVRRQSRMMLTVFGKLFVAACIPPEGFEPKKPPS